MKVKVRDKYIIRVCHHCSSFYFPFSHNFSLVFTLLVCSTFLAHINANLPLNVHAKKQNENDGVVARHQTHSSKLHVIFYSWQFHSSCCLHKDTSCSSKHNLKISRSPHSGGTSICHAQFENIHEFILNFVLDITFRPVCVRFIYLFFLLVATITGKNLFKKLIGNSKCHHHNQFERETGHTQKIIRNIKNKLFE